MAIAAEAAPIVTLPPRTMLALGAPALTDFAWRSRAGQQEYERARAAEKIDDWATVVEGCGKARGIDASHLDAAWLEAVGQARLGHLDAVIEPLERATSGDWGKWGQRALTAPVFAAFRATAIGRSWVASADAYRAAYAEALARSFLLLVDGDIVAYDATSARWLRVTRSGGAIIAALRGSAAHQVAYVARLRDPKRVGVRLGAVDLTTDVATSDGDHELVIDGNARLQLSWRRGATAPWLELVMPTATVPVVHGAASKDAKANMAAARGPWMIDLVHGQRVAASDHGPRLGPELVVERGRVRISRLPRNDLVADWDEHALAGAIRVGHADRTVAAPDASMIDGNTVAFSPGGASLLFVTVPQDPCAPIPTLDERTTPVDSLPWRVGGIVVVELATGNAHRIADAPSGVQVDWIDEHRIAVAASNGFEVLRADGTIDDGMQVSKRAIVSLWGRPAAPVCASAVGTASPDEPLPVEDPGSIDDEDDGAGDKHLSGN